MKNLIPIIIVVGLIYLSQSNKTELSTAEKRKALISSTNSQKEIQVLTDATNQEIENLYALIFTYKGKTPPQELIQWYNEFQLKYGISS